MRERNEMDDGGVLCLDQVVQGLKLLSFFPTLINNYILIITVKTTSKYYCAKLKLPFGLAFCSPPPREPPVCSTSFLSLFQVIVDFQVSNQKEKIPKPRSNGGSPGPPIPCV